MNVQSPNDPWNLFWSLGYRRLVPIAPPGVQLIPESGIDPAALGKVPGELVSGGWKGMDEWQRHKTTAADCERWREQKLAEMDEDYGNRKARRERMRMSPGARFGEALADMVKAVERSRQQ